MSVEVQANTNASGEDFRSLLNSNRGGNSDVTVETARAIHEELISQMPSKLEENGLWLYSQMLAAIYVAVTEKVTSELHGGIGSLGNGITAELDQRSSGLHRNTE